MTNQRGRLVFHSSEGIPIDNSSWPEAIRQSITQIDDTSWPEAPAQQPTQANKGRHSMATTRVPNSPREIVARQNRSAEEQRQASRPAPSTAVAPAARQTAVAPAGPDNRTEQQKFLDEIAPVGIAGRLIKFTREGTFVTADDGKPIKEDRVFVVLADQTLVGYQRFYQGAPPERRMDLLYGPSYVKVPREALGDLEESDWPAGLSGAPEDPWQPVVFLVLQDRETSELFTITIQTIRKTKARAVGNLLKHYDRMKQAHPDELPVVQLKPGGYSDDRFGFVPVPVFCVVGRAPRDSVLKPDVSTAADLDDEIPFN
jgi:hypothetical protein